MIWSYGQGHVGYIPDRAVFERRHPNDTALGTWDGVNADGTPRKSTYLPGYGTPTIEPMPEIGDIVVGAARELIMQVRDY